MTYRFHPEALDEYDQAAAYYATCQPGLEIRFLDAVEATIQRVCEAPERWQETVLTVSRLALPERSI